MPQQSPLSIVAGLPIRSLRDGKQRLAGALTPAQREHLIRQLALGVMHALRQVSAIQAFVVVSGDEAALAWAGQQGSGTLYEAAPGLNPALEAVRKWAALRQADGLFVILPDLPFLSPADVMAMISLSKPRSVTLAPDRHGTGTNALLVRPANLLPFRFGQNSLEQHEMLARSAGLTLVHCTRPGFAFDLDTPDDLAALARGDPLFPLTF
jgi:2-phospho-L-lactate guanylyltransferase